MPNVNTSGYKLTLPKEARWLVDAIRWILSKFSGSLQKPCTCLIFSQCEESTWSRSISLLGWLIDWQVAQLIGLPNKHDTLIICLSLTLAMDRTEAGIWNERLWLMSLASLTTRRTAHRSAFINNSGPSIIMILYWGSNFGCFHEASQSSP